MTTPIDHGNVCVNFDRGVFEAGLPVPASTFDALIDRFGENDFVVEDPSTSTPGLAFHARNDCQIRWRAMMRQRVLHGSAVARKQLKANGVTSSIVGKLHCYATFSGGSGKGDRPLVVSYASSPPAEVSDTTLVDQSPTGVVTGKPVTTRQNSPDPQRSVPAAGGYGYRGIHAWRLVSS